jgi:ParB family chromosome partitioning protein
VEIDMARPNRENRYVEKIPKRKKTALGRGLDSLIPDLGGLTTTGDKEASKDFFLCDINLIHPNRYQPRTHFSAEELTELSNSIKTQGILQPLLVRKATRGYELVAGERRLRASKQAGLEKIPVMVKDITDAQLLEISIVENIQREDLNPMEEAEAYHRLMTEFDLTQEECSHRVGKSRSAVANFLRLRQLAQPIKDSIVEEALSMGHARALLGLDSTAMQTAAWKTILAKKLSVRQTEDLIKRLKAEVAAPAKKKRPNPLQHHLSSVAEGLSRHFGTKVEIKRRGKKGKVEIEFYNDDDLERLLGLLNPPLS